ncbi:MAG: DUF4157 domain-containing protein, partial [Gemmatimonadales bacterium]|nr:DUF4157 domain-containing protein [Gemmatimonadales bacterium]
GGDTDEKHWDPTGKQQPSKVIQVHLGKKFMLTGSHWFGVRHVNKANAGDSVGDAYRNGQAPLVQRKAHSVLRKADAFAARIQRKAGGVGGGNDFDSHLQRSSGGSLPAGLNSKMSGWLGSDFSGVRVHTDTAAQKACAAVNAEAFTLGNDVYFGKGFYNTSSAKGVALIGHELTHVAQNMGGAKTNSPKEVRRKAEIRRSELSGVAEIRRKQGYTIAGNDRHEKQAVSNERMIAGEIRRKEDGGFADYAWDRIKDGSIRDQVFGIAYGLGLDVGNPTAGDDDSFASFLWERVVAGGVSDQIFAYAEGLGTGVTNAVEGTYELLTTDPRKTYAAVEKAIDNHELVYAAIKDKLAEYADARNDPEKFARMTGVLVGEILAGIAADKGIGKVGSVVKGTRAGAATFNAAGKVVRLPLKVVSAMVLALRTVGTKFPEIRKTLAKTLPPDSLPDLDQAIDLQRAKEVQAPKRKVITVAKIQEAIRKQRGLSVSYDEIKARLRKRFPERHWERLDEILLDEFNLEKNAVSKANQYAIKVGANSVEMGGESFELTKGRGRGGTFVWELPGHKGIGRSRAGDWAKVEVEEAIDIVDGAAVKRLHIHGIYNSKTLPPGLMRNLMRELIVESNLDDFGSISGTVANDLTNEVISKFDGGPIPSSALSDTKLGKMREFIAESSGYRVTGHSWDSNLHQLVTHVEKQVKAPELPTKGGKLGAIIPDEALRTLNNDPMGWFPETPQRGLDWAKVEKFRDLFAGGEELKMTVENGMDTAVSISGITGNGGRAVMNGQHRVAGYFLAHGRWPDLDNLHVHENKPEYGLTYSYKPWFPEADQTISRKYSGAGMGLGSGDFDGHLRQSTGGSLPGDLGTQMSGWLGADFSGVRIHTDTAAQRACAAVNAEAFTIGSSVYFGKGFYSPSSAKGVALIGHELTHVAQNIGGAKTISPKELRRKEAIRRSELSERATSIQRKEEGFGSFFWSRLKSGEVRDDMYNGILAPFTTIGAAGTFFYGIATSDPFEVMGNGTPTEVEAVLLLLKGRKTITPDIIYAAARQVAGTNRAALRLSLKVVLEHAYSLPLAQIAGIDARNKDINDKYKHFFSCAVIASFGSSHGATLTGYLKEAMDEMSTDRGFDDDDMIANRAGARFGY